MGLFNKHFPQFTSALPVAINSKVSCLIVASKLEIKNKNVDDNYISLIGFFFNERGISLSRLFNDVVCVSLSWGLQSLIRDWDFTRVSGDSEPAIRSATWPSRRPRPSAASTDTAR